MKSLTITVLSLGLALASSCSSDKPNNGTQNGATCGLIPTTAPAVDVHAPYTLELPEPTGAFSVGTHILYLHDTDREEPATTDDTDHREIVVQLFYPTSVTDGPPAPLMEEQVALDMASWLYMLPTDFNEHIRTRSTFDVPLASTSDPVPVILYSPGAISYRWDNQVLVEELASRGFLVATVSHPYANAGVELEGDRFVGTVINTLSADPTVSEFIDDHDQIGTLMMDVHAPDLELTLSTLEQMNADSCHWLGGRLDLQNVGMFGFSLGGVTALYACNNLDSCSAALNLDGGPLGDISYQIDKPIMIMGCAAPSEAWHQVLSQSLGPAHAVRIRNTNHGNFSMLGLIVRAFDPSFHLIPDFTGSIGLDRANEIYHSYATELFEEHVRGNTSTLLQAPSIYPEVLYGRYDAGQSLEPLTFAGALAIRQLITPNVTFLTDAAVSLQGGASVRTDDMGFYVLDGVAPSSAIQINIDRADLFPVTIPWNTGSVSPFLGMWHLFAQAVLDTYAQTTATTLQPDRGHVIVSFLRTVQSMPLGNTVGVQAAGPGTGPFYGREEQVDVSLIETDWANGLVFFFNVAPGSQTFIFPHATLSCRPLSGPPLGAAGSVEVPVSAGRVTMQRVYCE